MSNELISVIIPAYNAEDHIQNCLDSLLNQTYEDFKIYVVNDGSTDGTREKLRKYESNPQVEIIEQTNKGVSAARNVGLTRAKGNYISFVDADDTVETIYLETLVKPFTEHDISLSVASYYSHIEELDKVESSHFTVGLQTGDKGLANLLTETGPQGYLWNKLFLAQPIREKQLNFKKDVFMAEDLLFTIRYLLATNQVYYVQDIPIYHYVIYKNSSNKTRIQSLQPEYYRYFDNFLYCLKKIEEMLPETYEESKKIISSRRGRMSIQYLRANLLMDNDPSHMNKELRQIAWSNRRNYFRSSDASLRTKVIYMLVLLTPKLALMRDKKRFNM